MNGPSAGLVRLKGCVGKVKLSWWSGVDMVMNSKNISFRKLLGKLLRLKVNILFMSHIIDYKQFV